MKLRVESEIQDKMLIPRLNVKGRVECKMKDPMINLRSNYGMPAWIQKSVFNVKLRVECEI